MTSIRALAAVGAALVVTASAGASPTWQPAVRLSASDRALSPELARNAAGAAAVVWDHEQGADCPTQPASLSCVHIVEAATRPAGAAVWQSPIEVARPGIGALPRAAIDPAGDIAIVWVHDIGQDRVLQATIRPAGAPTWPNANDLSGSPLQIKNHEVALDAQGNAAAVWAQRDSTTFYVVGDLRPAAGGAWLAPVALSSISADATSGPALASVPSGEVLVAWIDSGALRVARGNASTGTWDAALTPAGGGVGTDTDVDVALNAAGDAVAAWSWRRAAAGANIVQAAFRPAGGNWGAVTDLGVSAAGRSHVAELAPAGPVLAGVQVPANAKVDSRKTFSVSPRAWAAPLVGSPLWRFGDGKSASGAHVTHIYRSAGTFTVAVTQTDTSGARSTATRKVSVTSH